MQRIHISQNNHEKQQSWKTSFFDFEIYKAIVLKTMGNWHKNTRAMDQKGAHKWKHSHTGH